MSRNLTAIIAALALAAIATTASAQNHSGDRIGDPNGCNAQMGADKATLGALYYFRDVFQDAIDKVEHPTPGYPIEIETHSDWLCWMHAKDQKHAVYLAEMIIVFIFDILPGD